MVAKTQAARQPSIDELLASIRQAIQERVTPGPPARPEPAVNASPQGRPRLAQAPEARASRGEQKPDAGAEAAAKAETAAMKRTMDTSSPEGFAGLLGGDVRLEEALARLNQVAAHGGEPPRAAERPRETAAPVAAPAPGPGPAPRLRPSIQEWTGESTAPAVSAPVANTEPKPERGPEPKPEARPETKPAAASAWRGGRIGSDRKEFRRETPMPDERTARDWQRPAAASDSSRSADLLSSDAASQANSAFSRLTEAVGSRPAGGDPALDEMTRECLRPLLKAWLDENLPGLVERLVREEIERVARSGR